MSQTFVDQVRVVKISFLITFSIKSAIISTPTMLLHSFIGQNLSATRNTEYVHFAIFFKAEQSVSAQRVVGWSGVVRCVWTCVRVGLKLWWRWDGDCRAVGRDNKQTTEHNTIQAPHLMGSRGSKSE